MINHDLSNGFYKCFNSLFGRINTKYINNHWAERREFGYTSFLMPLMFNIFFPNVWLESSPRWAVWKDCENASTSSGARQATVSKGLYQEGQVMLMSPLQPLSTIIFAQFSALPIGNGPIWICKLNRSIEFMFMFMFEINLCIYMEGVEVSLV